MNHLFLLILAVCSSSVPVEKTNGEPTPIAPPAFTPIVATPPLSLEEVRAHKTTVEIGMQQVIDRAKAYPGASSKAIAQAEAELSLFKNTFAPMIVEHASGGLRVTAVDPCPSLGQCIGYTVADSKEGVVASYNGVVHAIASYDSVVHAIVFSTVAPANDPYTPFAMFHELSHTVNELTSNTQEGGSLSDDPAPGTPNPTETQAYALEAELLNAATHGKYFAMAGALTQMVVTNAIAPVTLKPGPVNFFHPPKNMYTLLDGKMSEAGRQSFTFCMTLTVNRVLISTRLPEGDKLERHQATLYSDTIYALHSASAQKFMRKAFHAP